MAPQTGEPNAVLAGCLDELGWSPKALARKLNRVFGAGTVAESAPYHWRDAGSLPRAPLPMMAAYVLSQELGRNVSVAELWQGRVGDSSALVPADTDLARPWTAQGMEAIVEDWVMGGLVDRRRFLTISGAGLLAIVAQYLDGSAGRGQYTPRMTSSLDTDPLVDQVEQHLPMLQLLDDKHGGARHLPYVGARFRAVGLLIRERGHPPAAASRLLRALAEIGQLAGWMAFDAADHGLAQRYFVTALRAARQVNDLPLCAHILGDLSFQAASRGHPADAIALGEAARRASHAAPLAVRASVLSRLAYAYAGAGRDNDFAHTRGAARELIASRDGRQEEPRWMYFLTDNHLDCQAGYGLIQMGRAQQKAESGKESRRFLAKGIEMLRSGAYDVPRGDPSQRRAMFEGAWLALGHSAHGDLEAACEIGQIAADRLDVVRLAARRCSTNLPPTSVADSATFTCAASCQPWRTPSPNTPHRRNPAVRVRFMTAGERVVVVGAGVAGLTTAVVLAEAGASVHVIAEQVPGVTSLAAGAMWGLYLVEPKDKVDQWGQRSLEIFRELAQDPATGVRLTSGIEASRTAEAAPDWATTLPGFRQCERAELPAGFTAGYRFTVPLIDMPTHLDYLLRRLRDAGGVVERRQLTSLSDAGPASAIVNCAGLGARDLVPDPDLRPIRGQHVVVTNPGLTEFFSEDTGLSPDLLCFYPHGDNVVLGGTAIDGEGDLAPDDKAAAGILARCAEVEPRLAEARVLEHRIGARPTRATVRVEEEVREDGTVVVHNYGHGGAGVTLSWGCAEEARTLLATK